MMMFPSRLFPTGAGRSGFGSASLNSLDEGRLLPVIRISGCSWRCPLTHAEISSKGGPMTTARVCVSTVVTGAVLVLTGRCGFTAQTGHVTTTSPSSVATPVGPSVQSPAPLTSGPYLVTKVVDGDTAWVQRDGQQVKLRLIGIDTPETHDPRKPVQCFGEAAAAHAESMLAGRQVLLETDDSQGRLDKYGRELVYVWVDGQL